MGTYYRSLKGGVSLFWQKEEKSEKGIRKTVAEAVEELAEVHPFQLYTDHF